MFGKSTKNSRYETGINSTCVSLGLVILCLFFLVQTTFAAVVATGDVDPADPAIWWTLDTNGYIGKTGNGTLDITSGSSVSNRHGYIGDESGATGVVTVDGIGSTWLNWKLYIGQLGHGTLNITNGGVVNNNWAGIGIGSDSSGEVTVDGIGSTWTSSLSISVGSNGSGVLNIINGGTVNNQSGMIGVGTGSIGEVTVDGVGSTWTLHNRPDYAGRSSLIIGGGGYQNAGSGILNITNGGVVTVERDTQISLYPDSSGTIHFANGTLTTGSFLGATDDLTGTGTINTHGLVSDVDLVFDATHGTNQTIMINKNTSQNITINLDADGSGYLGAGYGGHGTMRIADGIVADSERGYIGYNSNSTGVVTVDGNGSKWTSSGGIEVGSYGSATMNVIGGGKVISNSGFIARRAGSTGQVNVDGIGSSWTNQGGLSIGVNGNGTMSITNGGSVSTYESSICIQPDSSGQVTVDGVGSIWRNTKNILVGARGNGALTIIDGGVTRNNGNGVIGNDAGSTGIVTVDGVDSLWTSSGEIRIGHSGNGTMNITNGAKVRNSGNGFIGYQTDSTGVVTVDGIGSIWENRHTLTLSGGHYSYYGNGTLNITNGGEVIVEKETRVSYATGSSGLIHFDNGTLTTGGLLASVDELTGTGTMNTRGMVSDVDLVFNATHGLSQTFTINKNTGQNITVNLEVDGLNPMGAGYGGVGSMIISEGVVIESTYGYIGYKQGSTGTVTVDGVGSAWKNNAYLHVNNGNLDVRNGGIVTGNAGIQIGNTSGSTANVTVDGTSSTLTTFGSIVIGGAGNGSLNITDGGSVTNKYAGIKADVGFTSEVVVDGAGSIWTNNRALQIIGPGSELTITNGGQVHNIEYVITYNHAAVTVDGAGSVWVNHSSLSIGRDDSGMLNITNGGLVRVAGGFDIDYDRQMDSFVNMTTGGMLALPGQRDSSLPYFLAQIGGTRAIRYWENTLSEWIPITDGIADVDYALAYLTEGDLAGYTVLTVYDAIITFGDVNSDGLVDGFDVDPFVKTLLYGPYQIEADMNKDGVVDGMDVDPFVAMVLGDGVAPQGTEVPEPATLVLLGFAGLICGRHHDR